MVECEFDQIGDIGTGTQVLIDTWWNVNDYKLIIINNNCYCFNRYMVECECL